MNCQILATALALTAATAASASTNVIVFNSDPVPRSNNFFDFTLPTVALNNTGQIAFASDFEGPSGDNGAFIGSINGLLNVAQTGDVLPSTLRVDDLISAGSAQPSINDVGQLGLKVTLDTATNSNANDPAVLLGFSGGVTEVAAQGALTPTGQSLFFRTSQGVPINNAGRLVFSAGLFGTGVTSGTDEGIYRYDGVGNPFVEIVRKGQATPDGTGTFTGTAFQASEAFATPSLNASGSVVFVAGIDGSGVFDDQAVVRYDDNGGSGTLTEIARVGDVFTGGGSFRHLDFSVPLINDSGLVVFAASNDGTTSLDGVLTSDGTTTTAVAIAGQPILGVGTVGNVTGVVDLNNAGQVLFRSFGNSNFLNGILLADSDGSVDSIALEGALIPDGTGIFNTIGDYSLNESGQIAFTASVDFDPSDSITNDGSGLYLYDPDQGVIEILREGDGFLGSTITDFAFAGNVFDEFSGLNDLGQIAYSFSLADGRSGIALANVPEPSTALLFLGAGFVAIRRRR